MALSSAMFVHLGAMLNYFEPSLTSSGRYGGDAGLRHLSDPRRPKSAKMPTPAWQLPWGSIHLSIYSSALKQGITTDIYGVCDCLLYTSPSPLDATLARIPGSA